METLITEVQDTPEITAYEMKILQLLAWGDSTARIAQVLHIKESSVKTTRTHLCTLFDLNRPARRDWMLVYRKCMIVRKTIPARDVREVLQSAFNRSEGKQQEMILELAEELYIELQTDKK